MSSVKTRATSVHDRCYCPEHRLTLERKASAFTRSLFGAVGNAGADQFTETRRWINESAAMRLKDPRMRKFSASAV